MNAEQASKKSMRRPTRRCNGEGCHGREVSDARTGRLRRGTGDSMHVEGDGGNTGSPVGGAHGRKPESKGQAGPVSGIRT